MIGITCSVVLVHEFVAGCNRRCAPRINAWEAVHYMAPRIMTHKSVLNDGELLKIPNWGDAPA